MRFLHVDPIKKEIKDLELKLEANTFYTFFGSLLIDELPIVAGHTVYTDANALSQRKTPYFINEQLVLGEALVLGRNGFEEIDATLSVEDLQKLISYDVSDFYKEALELLAKSDANLYRAFLVEHNNEKMELNIAWVLYFFNIADERTRRYFLEELKKSIQNGKAVEEYMQKMAKAALQAAS